MTRQATDAVAVRPAAAGELAAVGRLTVAAYQSSGMIPEGSGYDRQLGDASARAEAAELFVALVAGALVGTVTFCEYGSRYAEVSRPGEAEFRMLAVDPEVRGAGVGEALVRAVLARAAERGFESLVLSTPATAAAARRLYDRLGFVRLPDRDWEPVPGVRLLGYRQVL
ncbi:MAG: GNAT family N-acetyltransferase [Micromonosporaceae bacterium]